MKTGRITAHRDPTTGQPWIDPDEADAQWVANTDPTKQAGSEAIKRRKVAPSGVEPETEGTAAANAPQGSEFQGRGEPTTVACDADMLEADMDRVPSLAASKARLEHYKALDREADYRKKIGELVDAGAVEREAFERGRALREAIMALPDRLMAELAAETDQHRVHFRLTEELIRALEVALQAPAPAKTGETA